MPLSERENYIRNATFRRPEWMPVHVAISDATWDALRGELEQVLLRHPTLFPDFRPGARDYEHYQFAPAHRAGEDFTDAWGCTWRSSVNGLEGVVIHHPLADWAALESFAPPDPSVQWDRQPASWAAAQERAAQARQAGRVVAGSLPHGFLFLRLTYLRGFENFMLDVATGDERLNALIEKVMIYNRRLVQLWLELSVDLMEFGDDLGAQKASLLSPSQFRHYLAPRYQELVALCHQAGALVAFHSDGYIMDIMDDLLATGIDIVNPQDLVNDIETLAKHVKGRVCIRLDVDRQKVVPYGTRQEIRELVEYEVRTLGSPLGGLELICGVYPPTPPENIDALCAAFEEFRTFWWDGRART